MLTELEYWQKVRSLAEDLQDCTVEEKVETLSGCEYAISHTYSLPILQYTRNEDAFILSDGVKALSEIITRQGLSSGFHALAAHAFIQDVLDLC